MEMEHNGHAGGVLLYQSSGSLTRSGFPNQL